MRRRSILITLTDRSLFSQSRYWALAFAVLLFGQIANARSVCTDAYESRPLAIRETSRLTAPLNPALGWRESLKMRFNLHSYLTGTIEASDFNIGRGVEAYMWEFQHSVFTKGAEHAAVQDSLITDLLKLQPTAHVLDLGAGIFRFIREMFDPDQRAMRDFGDKYGAKRFGDIDSLMATAIAGRLPNFTGITMTDPESVGRHGLEDFLGANVRYSNPKVRQLNHEFFEKLTPAKIEGQFGKADLVTDFYGVLNYSANLGATIEKLAFIMNPGADLWFTSQSSIIRASDVEMTTAEFMVHTGLFEKVSIERKMELQPEHLKGIAIQVSHLRRTEAPARRINLTLDKFSLPSKEAGGSPRFEWSFVD